MPTTFKNPFTHDAPHRRRRCGRYSRNKTYKQRMRTRKQNKWKRRLKKIAAPVAATGAVAGTMIIAGGRDTLAAVPESVQGVANIVRDTEFHSFDERKGDEFPSGKFFRDWYGARSRVCWL